MLDPRIRPGTPFTAEQLSQIEKMIGWAAPNDYRQFVQSYGGMFVGGFVDANQSLEILEFFTAEKVIRAIKIMDDGKSPLPLPIADDAFGGWWVYRKSDDIVHVCVYSRQRTVRHVAKSFTELLSRLVISEE